VQIAALMAARLMPWEPNGASSSEIDAGGGDQRRGGHV
jgi:hypothetical protein